MSTRTIAACDHQHCAAGETSHLWTPATVITAIRTIAALIFAAIALFHASEAWAIASLLTYWLGDALDGQVARWTDTETRMGGFIDILCDRLGCAVFVVIWAAWHPSMILPVAIFLLQFMVIDQAASLTYLRWPLRSPNYFYRIDRPVWLLNWSRIAKGANSGALIVTMVVFQWSHVATALAVVMVILKVWTVRRILTLPPPSPAQWAAGCLVADAGSGHAGSHDAGTDAGTDAGAQGRGAGTPEASGRP